MNLKNIMRALSAAALIAAVSAPASAAVVLDGWKMVTPLATATGIGHLNLSGGLATIEQEVNGSGLVYVGAKFQESGNIFSIGYTPENTVGIGDFGAPVAFSPESLRLEFSAVTGTVTALNSGGGFHYSFDTGTFAIYNNTSSLLYATGSIVGLGGNTSSTAVIGGLAGDSTVLASVFSTSNGFFLFDSAGNSLAADMALGNVLLQATTTNTVFAGTGPAACSFSANDCLTVLARSEGGLDLVRVVPEPGTLTLAGLALLGLGSLRRRRSAK